MMDGQQRMMEGGIDTYETRNETPELSETNSLSGFTKPAKVSEGNLVAARR